MKSFSSGEVAKICDVNPRTVIRWIEAKKLKAFKLPGRGNNRVKHSDLLDFLVQNQIPVPSELIVEQEKSCFIVSVEKQLVKNAQRIARNAGFVTQVYQYGIESGVEIAQHKPSLIMIDSQTSRVDITALTEVIEEKLEYKPHIIVFDEFTDNRIATQNDAKVFKIAKPIDNYALAMVLDSIVETEQEAFA
ncbi:MULTISPECIES: helix-turn-helix domain-containing protein [Alteromonadaceae]|jgi:CheY-like chemotaxis protein|uniref:Helix-turn-helix domain-containing protein n=1 Tax=Brumicola blandensis TaxID=3075611 RepID=A0AAW8R0Y4_9ALTE|nr:MULTISPECIES: helix-turn-helix domain-containing protein [unclassified Alteromonas]MDT0582074.1 helix-turn-helix domain-containing protein [Alteromonas sp. W409]MDT0627970.1 helix-turn-helix domain-containing protein [Alteromonas sp. W364]